LEGGADNAHTERRLLRMVPSHMMVTMESGVVLGFEREGESYILDDPTRLMVDEVFARASEEAPADTRRVAIVAVGPVSVPHHGDSVSGPHNTNSSVLETYRVTIRPDPADPQWWRTDAILSIRDDLGREVGRARHPIVEEDLSPSGEVAFTAQVSVPPGVHEVYVLLSRRAAGR